MTHAGGGLPTGELLKIMNALIKERVAPVHFVHLKKNAPNGHLTGAKLLAKQATKLARVNTTPDYAHPPRHGETRRSPIDVEKINADIPDDRAAEAVQKPKRKELPSGHRGRDTFGEIRDANRDKLFNAPSSGAFWKEVKRLADPKPSPIAVTSNILREVFEERLNPALVLPAAFDDIQHKINQTLGSMIPENTDDPTPERFFSEEWTEDDAAWVKNHLLDHSLDSASGEDATTYGDIMEIPNEEIIKLCNEYIRRGSSPSIWLTSIIVGLVKKGKPSEIPVGGKHDGFHSSGYL